MFIDGFAIVSLAEERHGALAAVAALSASQREEALASQSKAGRFPSVGANAVIPIRGVLLDEWSSAGPMWGATGYNYVRAAVRDAATSSDDCIVLDIDSPGGLVSGLDETVRAIEEASAAKPVLAVIRSFGCSAAYALACGADRIVASDSSTVGSIGARLTHVSLAGALDRAGVRVTEISSHPGKSLGTPYADLSEKARDELQASVNDSAAGFVALVARRRKLSVSAVNALDASSFPARSATGRPTALSVGLVDALQSADDVIRDIVNGKSDHVSKIGKRTAPLGGIARQAALSPQAEREAEWARRDRAERDARMKAATERAGAERQEEDNRRRAVAERETAKQAAQAATSAVWDKAIAKVYR
ncbi:MAG: hypothetical protein COC10_09675 [Sphingobium sp.]|nr:MAG: hypothetical protein COC10_09675 [Sphingobium sp.]